MTHIKAQAPMRKFDGPACWLGPLAASVGCICDGPLTCVNLPAVIAAKIQPEAERTLNGRKDFHAH
jgi:hypothetical protein